MAARRGYPAGMNDLILVVDDDLSVLQLFEATLLQHGLKVETAASGGEALAKVEQHKPRLVLLDMMLPDYGGLEVLELMRRRDTKDVPSVIVITGRFSDEEFRKQLEAQPNVVKYLEKPVRPSELLEHVHAVLGTKPPALRR